MPKVVDPEQRRASVAEAVWRVVLRNGLDGVSVRTVATEAGLSAGSLRHYFATQAEVLTFAMQLVIDRVRARVHVATTVRDVIGELLPLDAERRAEAEVWLAFSTRAQVDPTLRALRDTSYDLLEALCGRLVEAVAPGAQDVEVERLYALIDGLVLHAVMRPDRATPELLRTVVDRHLEELVH
ncbi:TetR/AcrR family transcriptional regulator [Streptacidiphilus jiangxiensis]|uniref:DNA-binding transcriptional regulator YbjK n=1 Tax=Streptacidiphilus jiangxiensis TaxID=235985 RepID=A0A1H7U561_STRJI|nr:TetR family transcriptional regulator C-terminal domain-containing protein [Streptacidiphilus jiangxiensis]SEL91895.1 DNA-binding transcriptional regulator YbjK [Streptacidiphilus jiangxiensis]